MSKHKHKHKIKKLQAKVKRLQIENADLMIELDRARLRSPEYQKALEIISRAAVLIDHGK
jgi:predicted RNase H-like nuclease (RuvC/YqgF family)